MAYQKKYYFSFKDIRLTERTHLVELWQNTETVLTAEEIKGHMNPFSVEMPEIDHKFQVVRGCGCQINLLSETDMKFFTGLYHVNPTDFMVKHYIDGVINFYGYLNAEMMSEPYDIDFNYQVSLTGNDGFSLMDRFSFIQLDESNYTGVKSKFELLQIIFAKIGLPFTEYRIALATTFTGYSGDADSSILHESFVDCANFYDEDDKPMTLRAVVESILAPYGAHIRAELGNIYITDIHSLASLSSVAYKQFTMSTGAYTGFIAIPNVKAIADIGYLGTGHSIERSGGVNRQVVSYSPYPTKTILEESLIGTDEFTTVPPTFSTKDGYYYRTLEGNKYWETILGVFEQSFYNSPNDSNVYIMWPRFTLVNTKVAQLKINPYLNISTPEYGNINDLYRMIKIEIRAEILIKTKTNPYDSNDSYGLVTQLVTYWVVKVGNLYYDNSLTESPRWTTTYAMCRVPSNGNGQNINDDFHSFIFAPFVDEYLMGNLEIEIWSNYETYGDGGGLLSDKVKEIWIKNIEFNLTRINSTNPALPSLEIPDNDIEYIGLLDRTFQNEGQKIELTCGTDTTLCDKAKILKSDGTNYSDITQWTRNAQTFKIEELLLGSVSSNYRAGFVTLSNMKLKNSFSLQNILTDTFIGSAKMMVKSAMINYQDNVVECSLIEILPDELIIVKDTTVT